MSKVSIAIMVVWPLSLPRQPAKHKEHKCSAGHHVIRSMLSCFCDRLTEPTKATLCASICLLRGLIRLSSWRFFSSKSPDYESVSQRSELGHVVTDEHMEDFGKPPSVLEFLLA